jgi:hypothetical protein
MDESIFIQEIGFLRKGSLVFSERERDRDRDREGGKEGRRPWKSLLFFSTISTLHLFLLCLKLRLPKFDWIFFLFFSISFSPNAN